MRFTFGLDALKQSEEHDLGDGDNNSNAAIGAVVGGKENNTPSKVRITNYINTIASFHVWSCISHNHSLPFL